MPATALASRSIGSRPGRASLSRMMTALGRWYVERRTMAALARLDGHLLRDVGFAAVPALEDIRRRLVGR